VGVEGANCIQRFPFHKIVGEIDKGVGVGGDSSKINGTLRYLA